VLLTPRGRQVKQQTLRTEEAIFVYDRDIIQGSRRPAPPASPEQQLFGRAWRPDPAPSLPTAPADATAWQALVRERRAWTRALTGLCGQMADGGEAAAAKIAVVQQGTAIAVEKLKQHLAGLQQRQVSAREWVDGLLADQASLADEAHGLVGKFAAVPAEPALQRFLKSSRAGERSREAGPVTLLDVVGREELRSLAARATKLSGRLDRAVVQISRACEGVARDGTELVDNFSHYFSTSAAGMVDNLDAYLEEVTVVAKKIMSDCDNMGQDTSSIAKTLAKHDRQFIPTLLESAGMLRDTLNSITEDKAKIVSSAMEHIQNVSTFESSAASVGQMFSQLELDADDDAALEDLDSVYRLPFVYGSLLVELIRRREWTDKMTADSTTLAEEMATYKDEEEKRRKKWLKAVGAHLSSELASDAVMGIDISLRSPAPKWTPPSRADVAAYIEAVARAGGLDDAVQDLTELLQALDAPSKQQARRASAFRHGSITDAAFGRNSLLLRGDGELIRGLQADKTRLEDRLKGSDSRVRKLEDLLHRQSQIQSRPSSRGPSGPPFQPPAPSPALAETGFSKMPVPLNLGAHGSRRSSLAQIHESKESKTMADRIVRLENELASEQAKTSKMQAFADKQRDGESTLQGQMEEATLNKKDLMDNFTAQQHEFDDERRSLLDDNRKLKIRLEELDEEFDRILGSHDNARQGLDERTRAFDHEMMSLRERTALQVKTAQNETGQIEKELGETKAAHAVESTEAQAQLAELQRTLRNHDEARLEHQKALRAAHLQLVGDSKAATPTDFDALVDAIETLGSRASDHLTEVTQALESARSDNAWQEKHLSARGAEISRLKARVDQEELEVFALREEAADCKARYASLETELENQHQDLEALRAEHTAGESGSQALRERLAEEEARAQRLAADLASAKATKEEADTRLVELTTRLKQADSTSEHRRLQLDARAKRAEELSVRLYSQNVRMLRLLEQIGYTATRQNGDREYSIQKTSKMASGSAIMDSTAAIAASRTLSPTHQERADEAPAHLHWAHAPSTHEEQRLYSSFAAEMAALDVDGLAETVAKRVRDTEHVARKWQREAKNYRERCQRAQAEAQHKIAFRGFRAGDLALFLPTRNQALAQRSWAAFNVGAPHYFLRESEAHALRSRDWLVARISRVQERAVDLSRGADGIGAAGDAASKAADPDNDGLPGDDDNPFGLSDGLRWYYLDAAEERLGAPTTPGLAKSTVASAHEHATGCSSAAPAKGRTAAVDAIAAQTLAKSLDSRRSSSASKKSAAAASPALAQAVFAPAAESAAAGGNGARPLPSEVHSLRREAVLGREAGAESVVGGDDVRKDLLLGP